MPDSKELFSRPSSPQYEWAWFYDYDAGVNWAFVKTLRRDVFARWGVCLPFALGPWFPFSLLPGSVSVPLSDHVVPLEFMAVENSAGAIAGYLFRKAPKHPPGG